MIMSKITNISNNKALQGKAVDSACSTIHVIIHQWSLYKNSYS